MAVDPEKKAPEGETPQEEAAAEPVVEDAAEAEAEKTPALEGEGEGEGAEDPELQGERWYEQGSKFLTYPDFKECPMGRDILGGDPYTCEMDCQKAFKKLMTRDEHEAMGDRWALKEMADTGTPWKFLSPMEKVEAVIVNFVKFCSIWGVLYMFIISLGLMGNAFKILGGRSSGRAFRESELLGNPVSGLAIGILATVLMQSSSTTTSIVISMAAAELVTVEDAAYLVMGANIGTSVTNTIVSIAHLNSPAEYRRAFTGAVFHDMFNWLTVGIFLPLEASSGFLKELAGSAVDSMNLSSDKRDKVEFIKKITSPASGRVVSVDKKLIEKIAQASSEEEVKKLEKKTIIKQKSGHVFRDTPISDNDAGVLLLFVSLTMLTTCLLLLVKLLQSVLKGGVASWTRYFLNIDFKHPILRSCGGFDNYLLMLFGTGCTILVQSSSVFTSTLTPLVGIGLIHIEKLVALTQGANIGTTVTGVLSALSGDNVVIGMRVALEHVFFNVLGTVVWFIIWPLRPVPLAMAKFMGETAANLKWFPLAYILLAFLAFPGLVILLSIPGWRVLMAVGIPIAFIVIAFLLFIWVRRNRADLLPRGSVLRTEEVCGRRVPNFMLLWGGDLEKDRVDIGELQRKEKEAAELAARATEWPQSPGAWALAILAFVGLMLALPTSQWRRMRYTQEQTGRKEIGFGLFEVCTDEFKVDHRYASEPPLCDLGFMEQCAKELSDSCRADVDGASDDALSLREQVYERAWTRCWKAGCRTWNWQQYCEKLPGCEGRSEHADLCMKELGPKGAGDFNTHVLEQEKNGVIYDFSLAEAGSATNVVHLPHDNHFSGSANSVRSYVVPSQPLAGTVNEGLSDTMTCSGCNAQCGDAAATGPFCNDAPALSGITYDGCSGDLYVSTSAGPATTCGNSRLLALETFLPSFGRARLHHTYDKNELTRTITVDSWTSISDAGGDLAGTNPAGGDRAGDRSKAPWTEPTCTARSVAYDRTRGVGLSDVQAFGDETFIGADDFTNSLMVWTKNGSVVARYTPDDVLPASFKQAVGARGLVGVAVNADRTRVATCLRSPLTAGNATLEDSNVVRCAVLDVSTVGAPTLVSEKVVLTSDALAEYSSAVRNQTSTQADVQFSGISWLTGDKIVLMERAVSGNAALAMTLHEVDLSTGTNIKDSKFGTELEGSVVDGSGLSLNAAVQLVAAHSVSPMTSRKVYDFSSLEKTDIGDAVEGMFVVGAETVVLVESGAFAAHSKVHVVTVGEGVLEYDAPACNFPPTKTFQGGTHCRDIDEVCPVGDLKGDMRSIAGLVITGAVFLGIGTLSVIAYTMVPHHPVVGKLIFVSCGTLILAWVLILASWAHVAEMAKKEYGCLFLDESGRSEARGGGYVLLRGELQYITRPSYSWAFAIYAWGMLTISLCFVIHHVVRLTILPIPTKEEGVEEEQNIDKAEPIKEEA